MADLSNLRILAADDHPLIPAGLVSYLETEPGLKVVAEAGTARRRSRNIGSCGRTSS
jgi:DNA-binding NarL/FixJ family response regulator